MAKISLREEWTKSAKAGTIRECQEKAVEAIREGHINPRDVSIRELFEVTVPNGRALLDDWHHNPGGGSEGLTEAVSTTAFSSINRQLISSEVMQPFADPALIGSQLARTIPVSSKYGMRKPGLSRLANDAEVVGEGQPYPEAGFGEDFVQTPDLNKRGYIVSITKEAILHDLTGQMLDNAREVASDMAYNKELRILAVACGIVNTYNRLNRGVVNTYGDASGNKDWDNLEATNALIDYTDIDAARLRFDGLTDPNTGKPILVMGRTILVPQALEFRAKNIVNATATEQSDNQLNAVALRTISGNPLAGMGLTILSSPLVSTTTGNNTTWFLGDFTKAFAYRELWPVTVTTQTTGSEAEFERDIVARFKVSECGAASVEEPRYVVKCTA